MSASAAVPPQSLPRAAISRPTVFHDLSQPLTALQCSLELALVRDQTIEEFRASVEAALHGAERLRQKLLLLRELSDADDPGDTSTPLALDRLLQQLRDDMLPLFESAGRSLELTCEPAQVPANESKLMRGFFYLLEFLLRCPSPSHRLSMHGERKDRQQVEIRIAGAGPASMLRRLTIAPGRIGAVSWRLPAGPFAPSAVT